MSRIERLQRWKGPVGLAALAVAICSLVLAAPASGQSRRGLEVSVLYGDGRIPEEIPAFEMQEGSRELYITDFDLSRIFHATRFWDASTRKLVLRMNDQRFELTVDTRYVSADGEGVLMRVPVLYKDGSIMIPMEFLTSILAHRIPERIEWDSTQRELTLGIVGYNISDLGFESDDKETRVTIDLAEPLFHHVNAETPGLLRLKLYGGKLNPRQFDIQEKHGLVSRVRAEQTARDAFLYFEVGLTTSRFKVVTRDDAMQIVLVLEKESLPPIPDPDYVGKKMLEITDDTGLGRRYIFVKTVVIDPGHGGPDKGKVGPSGILEKDVNLEIAERLKQILEDELDLNVILTREDDRLVPLHRRTEVANQNDADLFISIHCNGWFGGQASGFETFFLSPAKTEWDAEVARVENASAGFEEAKVSSEAFDDLNFILWDLVQNEYINESSTLAELVQVELAERLDIRNRGVKQAGFHVLKGARMPAILIEVAFLSNPREEALLKNRRFQQDVVEGITAGISSFKERHEISLGRRP